mmetsp:Transcript_39714/g.85996  ORF Transcript_39714/g.85996 Transcript_39714/m.85996 type:complete len:104 (+) Transcript_39714:148-459(+)
MSVTPAAALAIDAIQEASKQASLHLLEEFKTRAAELDVKSQGISRQGDARDEILNWVEHDDSTMVVIGSRGHGMIKRALLGSVSDYVVHHCHKPVLVVKLEDE